MGKAPEYKKVGQLDYYDSYGTLIPIFCCQACWSLTSEPDKHTVWHGEEIIRNMFSI